MYQPMTIDKLAFNCFRSKENCKNSFENFFEKKKTAAGNLMKRLVLFHISLFEIYLR